MSYVYIQVVIDTTLSPPLISHIHGQDTGSLTRALICHLLASTALWRPHSCCEDQALIGSQTAKLRKQTQSSMQESE